MYYEYITNGVCSKKINFSIDENGLVHDVSFLGGCNGNLKAIGKLVEGMPAEKVVKILEGNTCGMRNTSCADQLSKALKERM